MCPNCNDSRGLQDTTDCFESLISLILPRKSWVAEWQKMQSFIPGVYALAISANQLERFRDGYSDNEGHEDDDLDGFVVDEKIAIKKELAK